MRDDFNQGAKEVLAKRVSLKCSNPGCRKPTSGPQTETTRAVNIGVAAHIAAASPGGARYDASMISEQRCSIENGIWLCQNCAKLIDNDPLAYTTEILKAWRNLAEVTARNELERGITIAPDDRFARVERDMPALIAEMREDLRKAPLKRQFTCISQAWSVRSDALAYYYQEHPALDDKVRILENLGLVHDVTRGTKIRVYQISEPFADYLRIPTPAGD